MRIPWINGSPIRINSFPIMIWIFASNPPLIEPTSSLIFGSYQTSNRRLSNQLRREENTSPIARLQGIAFEELFSSHRNRSLECSWYYIVHASIWQSEGRTADAATASGSANRSSGAERTEEILPKLPLGADHLAMVQLCWTGLMAGGKRCAGRAEPFQYVAMGGIRPRRSPANAGWHFHYGAQRRHALAPICSAASGRKALAG